MLCCWCCCWCWLVTIYSFVSHLILSYTYNENCFPGLRSLLGPVRIVFLLLSSPWSPKWLGYEAYRLTEWEELFSNLDFAEDVSLLSGCSLTRLMILYEKSWQFELEINWIKNDCKYYFRQQYKSIPSIWTWPRFWSCWLFRLFWILHSVGI